ncbi:LysR substrate-binding domain-containing protein [Puniceicoccaceae bacterium K14]|nr:LysR substrate-binding domain-containing protein [Puniceicoccaceae bacterium K14]
MELRHLRYFIAVALEENVSKAALKLHVSQPALSRQVRDLEEEMGVTLLERGAKSIKLTEAGRVFLDEASEVLERLEEGIDKTRAVSNNFTGELNIGYAPSLSAKILPPILREFRSIYPNIKVRLHDLSSEEMLTQVKDGTLDFSLFVKQSKAKLRGLNFVSLRKERILLAVSPNHRLAVKKSITTNAILQESLASFSIENYPDYQETLARVFAKSANLPNIGEESDSATSLIVSLEIGNYVAVVTDSFSCLSSDRIVFIPIRPEPTPLDIGLTWKTGDLSQPTKNFLAIAEKHAAVATD